VQRSPYADPRVAREIELIEPGRLTFSGPVKKRPAFESLLLKNAFRLEQPAEHADGTLSPPGHGLPSYTDPLTAKKAGAPNSGHTPGTPHPAELHFHIGPGDHKKARVCNERDCPHVGQTEKRPNPLTEHHGKPYENDPSVTFVTCEWARAPQIHEARFIAEGCGFTLRSVTAQGKLLVQDEPEHPAIVSMRRELDVLREHLNLPPRIAGGVANSPAWAMQSGSHSAQLARQAASTPWNPAGGVVNAGDYAVTQNGTPNMTVNIAGGVPGGRILIPRAGTEYAGLYFGYNDASVNLTGFTAPSANTWISTVYAQAEDTAYGDATTVFHLAFATGSAASSPVAPSLAVSSMALANVAISSTTTSITTGLITNVAPTAQLETTAGNLIATHVYGGASTYNLGSWAAVDTTNATLALTVPASGNVDVDVEVSWTISATNSSGSAIVLGLGNHTGGAQVGNSLELIQLVDAVANEYAGTARLRWHLTGLTPGALQLDLYAFGGGVSVVTQLVTGAFTGGGTGASPLLMQAFAA
jgi:hypothetical protein